MPGERAAQRDGVGAFSEKHRLRLEIGIGPALNRPPVLRKIDRIAVGVVNPVFGLAVWRSFIDAAGGVEFFADLS